MSENNRKFAVLGAGSYGTSLAVVLSKTNDDIILWGHRQDAIEQMIRDRENKEFLPDIPLPDSLALSYDLEDTIKQSKDLLIVVPSSAFAIVLKQIKPYLEPHHRILWATKGLEEGTGRLLTEVATEILGKEYPKAVLSGPTFAKELARDLPTAISLVTTCNELALDVQKRIHKSKAFRVFLNTDMVAVSLGGAVKNVIAIGAGLCDGLGFGANSRTALITRGLCEIGDLCKALGGKKENLMSMAGLGDLILTCSDNQSRNRRFGMMIGQGKSVEDAIAEIGQVVEGYHNCSDTYKLAQRVGVKMPIVEKMYQLLVLGQNRKAHIRMGINDLLSRELKVE